MNDFEQHVFRQKIFSLSRFPSITIMAICAMDCEFYYQAMWFKGVNGGRRYKLINGKGGLTTSCSDYGSYEYIKDFGKEFKDDL